MIALCLGGATSVWGDLARAQRLFPDHLTVACNYAGIQYAGHLDAWITLHPERFDGWREERAAKGFNTDYQAFVHGKRNNHSGAEIHPERWSGSSGLFMAQVALEALGADRAILCGVPMDAEQGHVHWGRWTLVDRYREGVLKARAEGAPITSMSGWTAEVLGSPEAHKEIVMRVKFNRDYDWTPPDAPASLVAYPEGYEGTVKREAGEAAVAAGAAVELDPPKREAPKKADGGS